MKPTLVVMAAGMGSRFGGLKQIRPFGPDGEIIVDYTLYDAYVAGFGKIVFVIKQEMREDFERIISGNLYAGKLEIEYAYQSLDDLPMPFSPLPDRVKPWGTGHAVYAAREHIDAPFGIVGADDFFGRDTIVTLGKFLSQKCTDSCGCMVGFALGGTASENGSVSRGVCEVKNGKLAKVTERTDITLQGDTAVYTDENGGKVSIPTDTTVSMNVWGFAPSLMGLMQEHFTAWLHQYSGELKKEYYLPAFVDDMIHAGKLSVEMCKTTSRWYGVTYGSDAEVLSAALSKMHEQGEYPALR